MFTNSKENLLNNYQDYQNIVCLEGEIVIVDLKKKRNKPILLISPAAQTCVILTLHLAENVSAIAHFDTPVNLESAIDQTINFFAKTNMNLSNINAELFGAVTCYFDPFNSREIYQNVINALNTRGIKNIKYGHYSWFSFWCNSFDVFFQAATGKIDVNLNNTKQIINYILSSKLISIDRLKQLNERNDLRSLSNKNKLKYHIRII